MKIYLIAPDFDCINDMLVTTPLTPTERLDLLTLTCTPKLQNWPYLEVKVFRRKVSKGCGFYSSPNLCFDDTIKIGIQGIVVEIGEILPLHAKSNKTIYLLNVLNCIDAFDKALTIFKYYSSGTRGHVIKHVFDKSKVEGKPSIFKVPETSITETFVYTDCPSLDPSQDFYKIYHEKQWTGLKFELIE